MRTGQHWFTHCVGQCTWVLEHSEVRVSSIALPVVGSFSLLWRTSSSSSWKNTQIHPVEDLHLNGTGNPTLDSILQKIWIPFVKIKPNYGWLLSYPYQKNSGLPVVSDGSNQLFRGKNVIQMQLWILKILKLGSESNYNYLDQFVATRIRTSSSKPSKSVTNQHCCYLA